MSKSKSEDTVAVIDWDEALEQCGGEQEFLYELLSDLFSEAQAHVDVIKKAVEEIGGEEPPENPQDQADAVRRAGHSIKGAAANLMCYRLRDASQILEKRGTQGVSGELSGPEYVEALREGLRTLELEMESFQTELSERGVIEADS